MARTHRRATPIASQRRRHAKHPQPLASQRQRHAGAPHQLRHNGADTPSTQNPLRRNGSDTPGRASTIASQPRLPQYPSTHCVTTARTHRRATPTASQRRRNASTQNPLRHNGSDTPARLDACVTKAQLGGPTCPTTLVIQGEHSSTCAERAKAQQTAGLPSNMGARRSDDSGHQLATYLSSLSLKEPIRIMMKSISTQMPKKPPIVTMMRIPVPILPT